MGKVKKTNKKKNGISITSCGNDFRNTKHTWEGWLTYGQIHRKQRAKMWICTIDQIERTDDSLLSFFVSFHLLFFQNGNVYTTTNFTYKTELISQSLNMHSHPNKWGMRKKGGGGAIFFSQMEFKICDVHLINCLKYYWNILSLPTHNEFSYEKLFRLFPGPATDSLIGKYRRWKIGAT